MAGLRKDVELIFRGEDRASPTIKSVRSNVRDLSKAISEQVAAAERGEGSIDDLAAAYKKLDAARGDIGEITKIAAAYEKLNGRLEQQSAKVEEARQKQERLNAEIAAAANPTQRLLNARDAADRQLQSAITKQEQYKAELREVGAALDKAGGDSRDFAKTQDLIRAAALETARALRDAGEAMDQFKGKQAGAKAASAAQDEASQFNALAAGSGLPQAQIQFISTLENRLEALQTAIQQDRVSMSALNAELRDQAAKEAAARVNSFSRALDEADQKAQRLKVTAQFRSMAAEIEANAREIGKFGPAADSAATAGQRLASTLDAILNPTQAVVRTMDGVNQTIAASEAILTGAKRRMSEYNGEINNLQAAIAGLTGMARLIDEFRQQQTAVAAVQAQFDAAQADVIKLAQAMQTAEAPTQEMATNLQRAQGNLEKLGGSLQRETTKLVQLKAALTGAKIDVNNLATAEQSLVAAANRAAAAQTALRNKVGGKGNFLGLRSFELQNLGFQINDIVTGLISGQRPLVVFAQQGLQIGQIVPGAFAKIVRFAGPLAILAVVLGTVAGAMNKVSNEAERLEMGQGIVSQLGAGTDVTAQQFADLAGTIEDLGVKADKTREILVQLAADGLDGAQMEQYVETAKAAAEVTGTDFAEALEKIRSSFQGGMDDIISLDDATNTYTDDEIALIQQLFEQGKADEARAVALGIYQTKMQNVADNSRGPWRTAVDQLSQAWQNFLGWLGHTSVFEAVQDRIHKMAVGFAFMAAMINQVSQGKFDINEAAKTALGVNKALPIAGAVGDRNRRTNAGNQQAREDELALRSTRAENRAAEERKIQGAISATTRAELAAVEAEKARQEASAKGLSNLEVREHVERRLALFNEQMAARDATSSAAKDKRDAASSRRREAAAKREARAAEAEANRIANMREGITRQLEQLDARVSKNSTESLKTRLSAIDSQYEKLFRDIDEYSQKTAGKGLIGDMTIEQAREHVRLQKEALQNLETGKFYEEQLNDLEEQRKQKLEAIADEVARGLKTPAEGLAASREVISDYAKKMTDIAQTALVFAQAIRGAKPDPALDALIEKFKTIIQNNSGGQNVRDFNDVLSDSVEAEQAKIQRIISQRSQLIDLENMKVQFGLQTQDQAQKAIIGHYNETRPLILQHIQAIRAMAAAYGEQLTPEMRAYFDALEANLKGVELESQGASQSFINLRQHMNEILTTNIVQFIDTVAQSFARLLSKQEGVMDFFADMGRAFLLMIAQILQTVATLIIEALVLSAVDKLTGGILKPLLQVMAATASIHHEGGIAGRGTRTRQISPLAFTNAPKYHRGGIAGLAPNETTAILKIGEEVLPEDDPRHRNNGGAGPQSGGGSLAARAVLAVGDDEIAAAMMGKPGEDVVLFHLRRNRTTIKQIIG